MSVSVRRLILLALGILAGVAAWPAAELLVWLQGGFPSYLVFIATLGAVVGVLMGTFFGAAEGITSRVKPRIRSGMLLGALVGLIGGAVGLLAGQAALWLIGEIALRSYRSFQYVVLPVSHSIGWAALGLFVGLAEGIRAGSGKKMGIGMLGGLVGGLLGGFALEYSRLFLSQVAFSRLIGLVILGIAIGGFYGLIERGLSLGVLRVLTGALKGKEFLLNQNRLRIGRSRRNEIALPAYEDLAERQAEIRIRRGEVVLASLDPKLPLLVNDRKVQERKLKYGDVFRVGSAKFYFKYQ
jgi:hypothetical protein